MKRYMHPVLLVVSVSACILLLDLLMRGLWGVAFSLTFNPNEAADQFLATKLPHDWPFIIAKFVWMMGFSAGLIGFTINAVKFVKLRWIKRTPYRYGNLDGLDDAEFMKLRSELEASDCGIESLKEMYK